jgi:hypothetical protein
MNCQIGDLAITVEAELPENIGKLVRIVGAEGFSSWSAFEEPLYLWLVEALGPEGPLVYDNGRGDRTCELRGLVPDIFLRPIRPRKVRANDVVRELANV